MVARRSGPRLAGSLIALPVTAGPVLLLVELDHGRSFAADTASAALLGLVGLASFAIAFARCARGGWLLALITGWLTFLVVNAGLAQVESRPWVHALLAGAAFVVAGHLLPPEAGPRDAGSAPRWDLAARALATACLVVLLTSASGRLGPALTGVYTPSPVALSVLAAFTLAHEGRSAASALLAGFLRAGFGFAAFFLIVAVAVRPWGPGPAFTAALSVDVALVLLISRTIPSGGRAGGGPRHR